MNPHNLSASDLMIWGLVAHLIADWPLQNDWMANHKQSLKHPAAYSHAAIHAFCLSLVFGWAAFFIALVHLLIDTRVPVIFWSMLIGQTQPGNKWVYVESQDPRDRRSELVPIYDVGLEVRFWTDQVFHIVCIAIAALLVST